MLADIRSLARKHDSTIGAMGARWGLHTEQAFRSVLKGILEKFSGSRFSVVGFFTFFRLGMKLSRPLFLVFICSRALRSISTAICRAILNKKSMITSRSNISLTEIIG